MLKPEAVSFSAREAQAVSSDPFAHPDAQRRFRTIESSEELERALDAPWDKWTIFLHPAQREWVDRNYGGPARVSGSAGTGKTIVALHRAVHLARTQLEGRVLLTTVSDALANALKVKLRRLVGNEPHLAERIDVYSMDAVGERLYKSAFGSLRLATAQDVDKLLESAVKAHPDHGFSTASLLSEWNGVVDAWQLQSWEAYRDVQRLGRRTRLPEGRRKELWAIYGDVLGRLEAEDKVTRAGMFTRLADELARRDRPPYDFAVVDESQDINVAQLRFLAALGDDRPNSLFFAGDLCQLIFQQPFSWKSQGVDIRGRARTLHVNYRTSHQIRAQADRLLDPVVADVDGNQQERKGTVSVFNGRNPKSARLATQRTNLRRLASGFSKDELAELREAIRQIGPIGRNLNMITHRLQRSDQWSDAQREFVQAAERAVDKVHAPSAIWRRRRRIEREHRIPDDWEEIE
ncbi:MAG TPA: UvrD-helicase domain-containing protein [Rhodanobacteraceae bacterium]|nr:UvrD-helicase domain-containing protein [Rhodanobacteraceae bacterium]